ncbi:MAG: hypothetical protein HYX97_04290, partial [Chloroflexi bacterium]|nr:hypothetical protein [Chloroflexota bacterium]
SGSMAIDFESGRGFDATRRRGGAVLNKPDLVLEETARWARVGAKSLYLRMGDVAHLPPERLIERMEWFAHEVMPQARAM